MGRYRWLHADLATPARLALVADTPIGEIVSAPGHRRLRNPAFVRELVARFRAGGLEGDGAWGEPILIGIFTRAEGEDVALRSVECLDGHHRLLAGLASGCWRVLGDVPLACLDARVNGWPAGGAGPEERWIPLAVALASSLPAHARPEVPAAWGARGPTARVSGELSGADAVFAEEHRGIPLAQLLGLLGPG